MMENGSYGNGQQDCTPRGIGIAKKRRPRWREIRCDISSDMSQIYYILTFSCTAPTTQSMTTTPAPQLLQRVNNRGGNNSKEGTSESAMDENSGECDEEEYDQGIRSNSNDKDK